MAKIINGTSLYLALANYLASNAYLNDTAKDVLAMVCVWIDEAKAVQVPKWIPVTERLPKKEGTYFVVTKNGAVTFARYYSEHDLHNYKGEIIGHESGGFQSNRKVTHWMPMPEPPMEATCDRDDI